jgi:hypothetical protein
MLIACVIAYFGALKAKIIHKYLDKDQSLERIHSAGSIKMKISHERKLANGKCIRAVYLECSSSKLDM